MTTTIRRRQIGPAGDPGGITLQWWRDGARVARPGLRPEARLAAGITVGGDAVSGWGSAAAAAAARRVAVTVEASPAPVAGDDGSARDGRSSGGQARRVIPARVSRPRGRDLVGDEGDVDSPLGESERDLESLRSRRELPEDWIEARLRTLGIHPQSPIAAWGPGPVARAVRDVAGFRGNGPVRSAPSHTSVLDARDAAAAAVAVWAVGYVTEREAESAAVAAYRERGEPMPATDPLGRWLWLLAYRAARRDLRSIATAGLGGSTEDLPSVVRGEAAELALGSVPARETADRLMLSRDRRSRQRAYREIASVLARVGEDSQRQSDRTRARGGALVVARVFRDVVVGGESLRRACEIHGETMDGLARRCERLGVWESLSDMVRERAFEGSRPLGWLRRAALQSSEIRSRIPDRIPDADTSWTTTSRATGTPIPGGGIRVTGSESISDPDRPVGAGHRLRRRSRTMTDLAELLRLRGEIMVNSRAAARDIRERTRAWADVARGWREPGTVSGTSRKARRARREG